MASCPSWSVWTPKRGMVAVERLALWGSPRRLLIWDMGLRGSVGVPLGNSTSVCWSVGRAGWGSEKPNYQLELSCLASLRSQTLPSLGINLFIFTWIKVSSE